MPRLIWVFAGRTATLLVLSCRGSVVIMFWIASSGFCMKWESIDLAYMLMWAATWQNHQNEYAPSEDSDQPGHPPSLLRVLLSARRKLGSLATHWAHSEDSDQTGRMPRLMWVFAGRTVTLFVLSCRGSYVYAVGRVIHLVTHVYVWISYY